MRNPFRLKNLDPRFLPAVLFAVALLAVSRPEAWSMALGAPLVMVGLLVRAWAVGHLVKTVELTFAGPYAHLRHPLYLGTLCIAFGIAVMLGGWASLVAAAAIAVWFTAFYLPRKERIETERLASRHGPVYARYRAEVPALLPRRRPWRPEPAEVRAEVALAGGDAWRLGRYDANNELGTLLAVLAAVALVGARGALG